MRRTPGRGHVLSLFLIGVALLGQASVIRAPGSTEAAESLGALDVAWTFDAQGMGVTSPVQAAGMAVFGTEAGSLYAVNASTGERSLDVAIAQDPKCVAHLRQSNAYHLWHPPAVDGNTVFVAVTVDGAGDIGDDLVAALDVRTGEIQWCRPVGFQSNQSVDPSSSPVIVRTAGGASRLLVALSDAQLYLLDTSDGSGFLADPSCDGTNPACRGLGEFPTAAGEAIYVAGDGRVRKLSGTLSPDPAWTAPFDAGGQLTASPTYAEDLLYVNVRRPAGGGAIVAIDAATGMERWRQTVGRTPIGSPVVSGERVFVADSSGDVFAFDTSGQPAWETSAHVASEITAPLAAGGDLLYVGDGSGSIHHLTRDGVPQRPTDISAVATNDDAVTGVTVATADGKEFAYATREDGAVFGLTRGAPNVPMLGGDPARTGEMPGPGPGAQPSVLWSFDPARPSGGVDCPTDPIIVGGVIYFLDAWGQTPFGGKCDTSLSTKGTLYAIDLRDVGLRWARCLPIPDLVDPGWFFSGLLYVDGHIYLAIAGSRGTLSVGPPRTSFVVVDVATGKVATLQTIDELLLTSPLATDGERLYFAAFNGTEHQVYRLDLEPNSRPDPLFGTSMVVTGAPVVSRDHDRIYVVDAGALYASTLDGTDAEQLPLPSDSQVAGAGWPVLVDGWVYVGDTRGNLYRAEAANPTDLTSTPTPAASPEPRSLASMAATDQGLYVVDKPDSANSRLFVLDGTNLHVNATADVDGQFPAGARLAVVSGGAGGSDVVYLLTANGELSAVQGDGQAVWDPVTFADVGLGGTLMSGSPIVWDGVVYVRDTRGVISALGSGSGTFPLQMSASPCEEP